jgi:hypothetical protein
MSIACRLLIICSVIAALWGCAGRDFVRPDAQGLKNGETTYAQVMATMGQPRQEGTALKNEKTVKTASYAYASLGGKPLHEGVTAARAAGLYFYNDVLVGHEFISSWAEDHTDFDETKIDRIVKGRTTRSEVLTLLGKPSGYYVYPLIKSPTGEAAVYAYLEVRGFKPFRKLLIVTFDAGGIVTDVEYTSAGSRSP